MRRVCLLYIIFFPRLKAHVPLVGRVQSRSDRDTAINSTVSYMPFLSFSRSDIQILLMSGVLGLLTTGFLIPAENTLYASPPKTYIKRHSLAGLLEKLFLKATRSAVLVLRLLSYAPFF